VPPVNDCLIAFLSNLFSLHLAPFELVVLESQVNQPSPAHSQAMAT